MRSFILFQFILWFFFILYSVDAKEQERNSILIEQLLFRIQNKSYYLSDLKQYVLNCEKYLSKVRGKTNLSAILITTKEIKNFSKIGTDTINLTELAPQVFKFIKFIKIQINLDNLGVIQKDNPSLTVYTEKIQLFFTMENYFLEKFSVTNKKNIRRDGSVTIIESINLYLVNLDRTILQNVFF